MLVLEGDRLVDDALGSAMSERNLHLFHGLVLDALYRAAHGLAHGEPRPVPLINASMNHFGYGASAWRMVLWGDVSHLAEDEVTQYRGVASA